MRTNQKTPAIRTYEGAKAKHTSPLLQLRRSVMSCMLWENEFYESGVSIVDRIRSLMSEVPIENISEIAIEAREKMKLRHIPLLLVREMARLKINTKEKQHKSASIVSDTLARVIQRPDELTEFLALYWKDRKQPIAGQVKKGLARAFTKFSAYQLAKYNRDNAIKLRDVLFLVHAKPKDAEQDSVWKKLIAGELESPDTWEVALSAGADKQATFSRLISEGKLGGLALLRNLRNMEQAKVHQVVIKKALAEMKTERILPFRFIAAARYAPNLEPELETAMFRCIADAEKLKGNTVLMVDVSGSMDHKLSGKSEMKRMDAACGLAMLLREVCENVVIFTFSDYLRGVPTRRGFALRDAVVQSQPHGGTALGGAIRLLEQQAVDCDRLIVITDEQSSDVVKDPKWKSNYVINVASAKNGIGYGKWTHIDGWSEAIVDYIREYENDLVNE